MSRQSKNVKKRLLAAQITAMHKSGQRGAKQTTPEHGKDSSRRAYTKNKRPNGFSPAK